MLGNNVHYIFNLPVMKKKITLNRFHGKLGDNLFFSLIWISIAPLQIF